MPPAHLCVHLSSMDGELYDLEISKWSTIQQLKEKILEKLCIPLVNQKLVVGGDILDDTAYLNDHSQNGQVYVTLLKFMDVSIDELVENLKQSKQGSSEQNAALEEIGKISDVCKGREEIVAAVIECLDHNQSDTAVRSHALDTLAKVARKGHDGTVAAVLACFEDPNVDVVHKALITLPKIAENGDAGAVAALVACLERKDTFSRRLTLNELPKIAQKGNVVAISSVVARLEDEDSLVRRAAAETLRDGIVETGDVATLTEVRFALAKRLEEQEEDEGLRQTAKNALAFLEAC